MQHKKRKRGLYLCKLEGKQQEMDKPTGLSMVTPAGNSVNRTITDQVF